MPDGLGVPHGQGVTRGRTDRQAGRQADRQTARQTGQQTGRPAGRQTTDPERFRLTGRPTTTIEYYYLLVV